MPVDLSFLGSYVYYIISVLADSQFTKPYQGQTITTRVHSTVNFIWTFTGNPYEIDWGIKGAAVNDFEANGKILSLTGDGQTFINRGYYGRVNGSWSGNSNSGQVVFTLTAINRNDMKSYRCILRAGFGESDNIDDVQLIVEGNYMFNLNRSRHIRDTNSNIIATFVKKTRRR